MRDAAMLAIAAVVANACVLAILILMVGIGTEPYVQAAAAIVPWVLNGAAVWLLTRHPPSELTIGPIPERLILRWLAVGTGAGLALLRDSGDWSPLPVHAVGDFLVSLLTLPVACLFFLRLRRLAIGLESTALAIQAAVCAVMVPLAAVLPRLLTEHLPLIERSWIVHTLVLRPQPVAGCPLTLLVVLLDDEVIFAPVAATVCLVVVVLIQFLFRLNRVLRLQARIGGSTASNSRP